MSYKFTFDVYGYTELPAPRNSLGEHYYFMSVPARSLLDGFDKWFEVNPREAFVSNHLTKLQKDMLDCLVNTPDEFFVKNRGLKVTANDISYSPVKQQVSLELSDEAMHGLYDGGLTYKMLEKFRGSYGDDVYVELKVTTGMQDKSLVVGVAQSQNKSRELKENSTQNALGYYDMIKSVLVGTPYEKEISYKEIEVKQTETMEDLVSDNTLKIIPIATVLCKLFCFITPLFDGVERNLRQMYNRPGMVYNLMSKEEKRRIVAIYSSLLPDILELYDVIYDEMPTIYNKCKHIKNEFDEDEQPTNNSFGKTKFVGLVCPTVTKIRKDGTKYKHTEKPQKNAIPRASLFSLGKVSKYNIPYALTFPILSAMNVLVNIDKVGMPYWECNPVEFFRKYGDSIVMTLLDLRCDWDNYSKMGLQKSVWTSVHKQAEIEFNNYLRDTGK